MKSFTDKSYSHAAEQLGFDAVTLVRLLRRKGVKIKDQDDLMSEEVFTRFAYCIHKRLVRNEKLNSQLR